MAFAPNFELSDKACIMIEKVQKYLLKEHDGSIVYYNEPWDSAIRRQQCIRKFNRRKQKTLKNSIIAEIDELEIFGVD